MEVQTISVRLPVDLYEKLRLAAFERRESMNSLIVQGVELRLAQPEGEQGGTAETGKGEAQ